MPLDLLGGHRTLRPLRPHQEISLNALRASLASGHRRPMLQAPTGFGKTLTAAHIIRRALDRGKRIAFVVPALSLIGQTIAALEAEGIDRIEVIQGDHPRRDHDARVFVCSVQTLARRAWPDVDLVLVDEGHLAFKSIFQWMQDRPEIPFIGLSATPWTRGLGWHYDDLIVAARTSYLIEKGFLSKFVVFARGAPDLSNVGTVAGDFNEAQLADACNKPELVGDVIATWIRLGEDRPTLCFAVDRAHAAHLMQRFVEAGIAAEYIDAFTDRAERERIFHRFRTGQTRIICNVATLTVGIDLDVRCIIDARPTKSEMRFVQTIGRGLRTATGKDNLIVLDHAGNHLRLGLVADIHHDQLDDGKAKRSDSGKTTRKELLPLACEACSAVMPRTQLCCPSCGALRESKSAIVAAEGNLVELGSGASSKIAVSLSEMADFFGDLRGIAAEKGYREGWAAHKFKEKFGTWPDHPRVKCAAPTSPSLKTKNWVRSRQIAFARARANG